MLEPEIDPGDLQLIVDKWHVLSGRFYNAMLPYNAHFPPPVWSDCEWTRDESGAMRCTYVIDKEDCRRLLWAIDTDIECVGDRRSVFVKRYLVSNRLASRLFFFAATSAASMSFTLRRVSLATSMQGGL